jgi:signal transduction histidine kinase
MDLINEPFGTYLLEQSDRIVGDWKERAAKDPDIREVIDPDSTSFVDHLPEYVEALSESFLVPGDWSMRLARLHGETRFDQKYRLDHMVRDWRYLQAIVLEVFEEFAKENNRNNDEEMQELLRILNDRLLHGLSISLLAFDQSRFRNQSQESDQLQENLRKLRDEIEARSRFLQQATHDMQGTMTSISGASFLLGSENSSNDRDEVANVLESSVAALNLMFLDLSDMSRIPTEPIVLSNLQKVQAKTALEMSLQPVHPYAQSRLKELTFEVDPKLEIVTNAEYFGAILRSLASYVVRTNEGSTVKVEIVPNDDGSWVLFISDANRKVQGVTTPVLPEQLDGPDFDSLKSRGLGFHMADLAIRRLRGHLHVMIDDDDQIGIAVRFPSPEQLESGV